MNKLQAASGCLSGSYKVRIDFKGGMLMMWICLTAVTGRRVCLFLSFFNISSSVPGHDRPSVQCLGVFDVKSQI